MLEAHVDTQTSAVTQARIVFGRHCRSWNEEELSRLRAVARGICTRDSLTSMFPDRTLKAVKKQLAKIRDEMGCGHNQVCKTTAGPASLDPSDEGIDDGEERAWRRQCERSNRRYLDAMRSAGLIRLAA